MSHTFYCSGKTWWLCSLGARQTRVGCYYPAKVTAVTRVTGQKGATIHFHHETTRSTVR